MRYHEWVVNQCCKFPLPIKWKSRLPCFLKWVSRNCGVKVSLHKIKSTLMFGKYGLHCTLPYLLFFNVRTPSECQDWVMWKRSSEKKTFASELLFFYTLPVCAFPILFVLYCLSAAISTCSRSLELYYARLVLMHDFLLRLMLTRYTNVLSVQSLCLMVLWRFTSGTVSYARSGVNCRIVR